MQKSHRAAGIAPSVVIQKAIKNLRLRLGLHQWELGEALGERFDAGTVSRWERGKLAPHRTTCELLARLAKKHGHVDLAAAFDPQLRDWRHDELDDDGSRILALVEIALINRRVLMEEHAQSDGETWLQESQIYRNLEVFADQLEQGLREAERNGQHLRILDYRQALVWNRELGAAVAKEELAQFKKAMDRAFGVPPASPKEAPSDKTKG